MSDTKIDYDDVRCIGFALFDYIEAERGAPEWRRRAERIHDFISRNPHLIADALSIVAARAEERAGA